MAAKPETKAKTEKATKPEDKAAPKAKATGTAKAAAPMADGKVQSTRAEAKEAKAEKKHHHAHVERKDCKCEVKGCKREYRAKGYCGTHYKKWRQGEYGHRRYTACSSTTCNKPQNKNRHGYCEEHYQSYFVKGVAVAKEEAPAKPAKAEAAKTDDKTAAA